MSGEDRILALDLATKCGYAHMTEEGVRFGTWNLSVKPHNLAGTRFVRLQAKLDRIHACYPFDRVVFEDVQFSTDTRATQVWGGLLATMQVWCDRRQVRYVGVPVGTLKKHATGHGNAKKPEMVLTAKARGWNVLDDNQADACWLLDYARVRESKL